MLVGNVRHDVVDQIVNHSDVFLVLTLLAFPK